MKMACFWGRTAIVVALIALCLSGQTKKRQYSPHQKAFYLDDAVVEFVRPYSAIVAIG
jgi:hypothetical protein